MNATSAGPRQTRAPPPAVAVDAPNAPPPSPKALVPNAPGAPGGLPTAVTAVEAAAAPAGGSEAALTSSFSTCSRRV